MSMSTETDFVDKANPWKNKKILHKDLEAKEIMQELQYKNVYEMFFKALEP